MDELKEFREEYSKLIDEIKNDQLTYEEAQIRCDEMWGLVPAHILVSSRTLHTLMKEKYGDNPNWRYDRIFTLFV